MKILDKVKSLNGMLYVEVEGFFVERFINLCKINKIKIIDIKNINSGTIRFNINICYFKKLRSIARKTKCKVKIIKKKGMYFFLFKYRKRKIFALILIALVAAAVFSSMFVWNIQIDGNSITSTEYILEKVKESGIYIGKCKIGIDKNQILKKIRANIPEIAWAGLEINGSNASISIVEKTSLKNINDDLGSEIGDVVASKSGVITKLVVEEGTPMFKIGSYVNEGDVVIRGTFEDRVQNITAVHAKGIIIIESEYTYQNKYYYTKEAKKYTGKRRYNIGFSVENKEFYINYLQNSINYDKLKSSISFKLFGNNISLDLYTYEIYSNYSETFSRDELIEMATKDSSNHLNEIISSISEGELKSSKYIVNEENSEYLDITYTYIINERIGKFVPNNESQYLIRNITTEENK